MALRLAIQVIGRCRASNSLAPRITISPRFSRFRFNAKSYLTDIPGSHDGFKKASRNGVDKFSSIVKQWTGRNPGTIVYAAVTVSACPILLIEN
jgi:hypothetical protein